MNEQANAQKYVVTVLREHEPIAIVEVVKAADNNAEVDVFYPKAEDLDEIVVALKSALGGAQYLNWKQNGVLPVPQDFKRETQEGHDTPEDDAPF